MSAFEEPYDPDWGKAGVFVFGARIVDLRNGVTNLPGYQMEEISDCSNASHFCIAGAIGLALPKRCTRFAIGDTYEVNSIRMTVQYIAESDLPSRPYHPDQVRTYIFQSDYADSAGTPQRMFIAYSNNVMQVATGGVGGRRLYSWDEVYDSDESEFRPDFFVGNRGAFEGMAVCTP